MTRARAFPGGNPRVPNYIGRNIRGYLQGLNAINGVIDVMGVVMQRFAGAWIEGQRQYADEVYLKSLHNLQRLRRRIEIEFAVKAREKTFDRAATASDISNRRLQYLTGAEAPPPTGPLTFKNSLNIQGTSFRITIVDPTLLLRILKDADAGMRKDLARIASARFEPMIPKILIETFEETWAGLEDGAFPREYRGGIVTQILKQGDFSVTGLSPQAITVNMRDIFTDLGTSSDLREGYHYGAFVSNYIQPTSTFSTSTNRLRGGKGLFESFNTRRYSSSQVSLPYTGQPLRTPTSFGRYRYWLAMYKKTDYTARSLAGKTYKVKIPKDAWQKTKQARVNYWNSQGKAPQWLLLEYGQTKYAPKIPLHKEGAGVISDSGPVIPGNISNRFYTKLSIIWFKLVAEAWDEAWKHAQTRVKEKPLPPDQQSFRAPRQKGPYTNFAGDPYSDWVNLRTRAAIEEREAMQRAMKGLRGAARQAAANRAEWDRTPFYFSRSRRKQNSVGGID